MSNIIDIIAALKTRRQLLTAEITNVCEAMEEQQRVITELRDENTAMRFYCGGEWLDKHPDGTWKLSARTVE